VVSARAIGEVALIEPGVEAWSRDRAREVTGDVVAKGGVVVEVTEQYDHANGDIVRAFVCIDPSDLRWSILTELEVDRATVKAVNVASIVSLWRRLAEHLAYPKARYRLRRGPATREEVRLAKAIHELAVLVAGADGPLHGLTTPLAPDKPHEAPEALPVNVSALCD
jgi:hypothetical protein